MAYSQPLGLQQLISLSEVKVRQLTSGLKGNKYVVLTLKDEVILQAKEESNTWGVLLSGTSRSFNMDLHDTQNTLIFSLRRPQTLGTSTLEVIIDGSVASVVRRQRSFLKPLMHINDAEDHHVLRLKGAYFNWDLKLQTPDQKVIGFINKKLGGLFKEAFTHNEDVYLLQFPQDLDVRYKAAVIGACVLADYMYHER